MQNGIKKQFFRPDLVWGVNCGLVKVHFIQMLNVNRRVYHSISESRAYLLTGSGRFLSFSKSQSFSVVCML